MHASHVLVPEGCYRTGARCSNCLCFCYLFKERQGACHATFCLLTGLRSDSIGRSVGRDAITYYRLLLVPDYNTLPSHHRRTWLLLSLHTTAPSDSYSHNNTQGQHISNDDNESRAVVVGEPVGALGLGRLCSQCIEEEEPFGTIASTEH